MLRRVLIANRGEIALRILRACREKNLEVVCAYSQVDANQQYLQLADDSVCIGERDYLHINNILMAARNTSCDAIHPGYGFLAENAEFAEAVESVEEITGTSIKLVGPSAEHIRLMGNKAEARKRVSGMGVETVPGSEAPLKDSELTARVADEIGYPVLVKAAAGGGGRGIHRVDQRAQLETIMQAASSEAKAFFGSEELYLEKYLVQPRHVEIQVLGDGEGGAIHLGSRDCSIQRRHQKLIEEAQAPFIKPDLLDDLADQSVSVCRQMRYEGAGTLEFLYVDGRFYFIEMNTRIQVEHTITEEITGFDIVKAQLGIAGGEGLGVSQSDVSFKGHAIECRINAEDESFRPSPGLVYDPVFPGGPGVRVDTHLYHGYKVPHEYDSLVAKIITLGNDRGEALARMVQALNEFSLTGIETNKEFLLKILNHSAFVSGDFHNGLAESLN